MPRRARDRLELVDPARGGLGPMLDRDGAERIECDRSRSRGTCREGGDTASARRRSSVERASARLRAPLPTRPSPRRPMLSQQASPTWQPRANACSKRASAASTSPRARSISARKASGHETNAGHRASIDLVEGLVQQMDRILDLASQKVVAAEHGQGHGERLARRKQPRPFDARAEELAGRSVVTGVVPAGAAGHVHPGELFFVPAGELRGPRRAIPRPVRIAARRNCTQLISRHPVAAMSSRPTASASVVPSCRAAAPSSSVPRAEWTSAPPSDDERQGQELAVVDLPGGGHGAPHALDARPRPRRRRGRLRPPRPAPRPRRALRREARPAPRIASAAARSAALGLACPAPGGRALLQASARRAAPWWSPAARRQRTRRTWAFSS